jgi:lysyl-tRNA synthetase class I
VRLPGWCMKCRKVKQVRVQSWNGKTAVGICHDCEDGAVDTKDPHGRL